MPDELSITNESLAAMVQYCTVPPQVIEHMNKSIDKLMETYEACKPRMVQAHTNSFLNILEGFKTVLDSVSSDLGDSGEYVKKKVLTFQKIIDGDSSGRNR